MNNSQITKESNINKIFLMMGQACNFHCRYCLQTFIKKDVENKPISPDLYAYLDHLIEEHEEDIPIHIIFWGGEPLLYWNNIRKLVLHYEDQLTYGIISNGSLLTQERVDFLNDHGISFTLSHDGINTDKTRKVDILKNNHTVSLINQLHPMINAVISGYTQDFNALFDYWEEHYPIMLGHIEMLRITWDMPEDLCNIDLTIYRNGLKKFFTNAIQKIQTNEFGNKAIAALKIIRQVHQSIENKQYHFPKCNQVERVLNIDLDGNLYACHNSNIKIGHINDDRITYLEKYWKWLETRKKPECNTCEIKYYCQGGCPLDITNEACKLQKILYEEAMFSYEQHKKTWNEHI